MLLNESLTALQNVNTHGHVPSTPRRGVGGGNDLRRAALAGATGDFANVEVLRDDDRITLTVPYGTLGVQMEAIQIDPTR